MAGPRPNKINTSTLKSRILNIAQTSVYQVKLQPPSSVTSFLYREADISYGRDVGYSITQHKFDKDVEDISATEIRRQIGIEKS